MAAFACATLLQRTARADKAVFRLAAAGLLMHTLALAVRFHQTDSIPVGTSYELLETIAWAFVLLQLGFSAWFKISPIGVFSMLPAAILTLLPLGCPLFVEKMSEAPRSASNFAAMHALLAAISYAFMAGSAIAGAMYLAQQKFLRDKSHGAFARALPSLNTLERAIAATLGTATLLMAASAIIGTASAAGGHPTVAMMFKFAAGATVFLMQAALYALTAFKLLTGSKLAKFSIALALAALLLLIPVDMGI